MKHAKHTPGPWRVGDAGHAVFGPKDSGMYQNSPVTIVQGLANKANAHLIAAAPELLEALEIALKVGVASLCEIEQIIQIEKAIAKARGEA